jgi:hypothetical protein
MTASAPIPPSISGLQVLHGRLVGRLPLDLV